jgi:hypothetical protein
MAQAQIAQATQKTSSIMPDQTRVALKKVADTMRQAAGVQPAPASTVPAAPIPPKGRPPEPKAKPPAAPERRADVPGTGTQP